MGEKRRCVWCGEDELYQDYHDQEWGVPVYNDRDLFEKLILDGAQAGLSWITILRKRGGYKKAFDNFDPHIMARYTDKKLDRLMKNPAIVRNRLKIQSARSNARAFLKIQDEKESFAAFLWKFVDGRPVQNAWRTIQEVPTTTPQAEQMSKALKKAGFNFVGPTIVYAFMQATGMVNDHTVDCFRHRECKEIANH